MNYFWQHVFLFCATLNIFSQHEPLFWCHIIFFVATTYFFLTHIIFVGNVKYEICEIFFCCRHNMFFVQHNIFFVQHVQNVSLKDIMNEEK